jgi:hypothetical protein
MIFTAFNLLVNQLNAYIQSLTDPPPAESEVIMANIAVVDSANDAINIPNQRIILSLVNIEEEATMKNRSHYARANINDIAFQNPPVFLNLYMLVTAYYDSYDGALKRLSNVIQFFQSKTGFSIKNSPFNPADSNEETIEIYLDMFSLTFEQLNHLWGSLGGRQWPSVLYKVRLVRISDSRITGLGTLIERTRTTEKVIV